MEYFQREEKIPYDKDLLKILFKEELIKGALKYKVFIQI